MNDVVVGVGVCVGVGVGVSVGAGADVPVCGSTEFIEVPSAGAESDVGTALGTAASVDVGVTVGVDSVGTVAGGVTSPVTGAGVADASDAVAFLKYTNFAIMPSTITTMTAKIIFGALEELDGVDGGAGAAVSISSSLPPLAPKSS